MYAGLAKRGGLEMEDREALRATLFTALGRAGDPAVLAEALNETQALLAGRKADGCGGGGCCSGADRSQGRCSDVREDAAPGAECFRSWT